MIEFLFKIYDNSIQESKMDIDINRKFKKFLEIHRENAFTRISLFLNEFRKTYESKKIAYYQRQGIDVTEAHRKSRQSWVAFVGHQLEDLIVLFLEDFITKNNLRMIKGDILKRGQLNHELNIVYRKILVRFNEHAFLPDADIVIYKKYDDDIKVLAILSVKNSFRERYTETPYWKLKLMQDEVTRPIKVFMITPDNDDEVSHIRRTGPPKARVIMEYELDSIYLAREDFDGSTKVKGLGQLLKDLEDLI